MSIVTLETTETVTVESLLELVEQLPRNEQLRLVQLIEKWQPNPDKPPLAKPMPARPMPDDTRERLWVSGHKHEYAGQWVALDGDRLVAACANRLELSAAVKADGAKLPLILRIPSHEEVAQWEELKRQQPPQLPRDQRPRPVPMPDDKRERQWVKEHKHEYAGQWVALDGDRLVAACANRADLSAAIKADGAKLPLIIRVPSPDDLPFMGI